MPLRWTCHHDNDPKHTAKLVTVISREKCGSTSMAIAISGFESIKLEAKTDIQTKQNSLQLFEYGLKYHQIQFATNIRRIFFQNCITLVYIIITHQFNTKLAELNSDIVTLPIKYMRHVSKTRFLIYIEKYLVS